MLATTFTVHLAPGVSAAGPGTARNLAPPWSAEREFGLLRRNLKEDLGPT
jgi:hypothetical protein